ncbi:MAG: glycoside hydrolase family 127 protein [Oscillospiraceae bacterium]|nr:glycoside hydrolase family 127 protein [Oscillospiraceae bacterium]
MLYEISYKDCSITGGFWKHRQDINEAVTARAVYDRFSDTHRFELLKCQWTETTEWQAHFFWDSDIAKWLEGAAYLLGKKPNPQLQVLVEKAIDDLLENQWPDGYMNSYFTVKTEEPRLTNRDRHELYCAGHLMEAACAYYEATGEDRFLKAVCRYADLIEKVFKIDGSAPFVTGGHPEIELALVRLSQTTGEKRYFDLAKFFLDQRGNNGKDTTVNDWTKRCYDQSHMPLVQQRTAEGHAVRAMYIACGMADLALLNDDADYLEAAEAIFQNAVDRRMYITGGLGSAFAGEAFTVDRDLPSDTAYAETCAALSMIFFARRLLRIRADSRYADAIERVLYNGALSGVSLDGESFFYVNPLELEPDFNQTNTATSLKIKRPLTQRVKVFSCSCCPPNIFRVIASMSDLLYSTQGDTLYVHQYAQSQAPGVTCQTEYPAKGEVKLTVEGYKTVALRIPGWCREFTVSQPYTMDRGYAYVTVPADGELLISFAMPVEFMEADAYVPEIANKLALMRGPVVYCLEGVDNGNQLRNVLLDPTQPVAVAESAEFGIPILKTKGLYKVPGAGLYRRFQNVRQDKELTFIPYYAFANRGVSEMYVWLNYTVQ